MEPDTTSVVRPTHLAAELGISVAYASMLLGGSRPWTTPLALKAWRAVGVKLGPLAAISDDDCAQLERLTGAIREAATAEPEAPAPSRPVVAMGEGFAG
jgi:hypothetical protein